MKQDKKKLYESIMTSVAKEVKKALNEEEISSNDEVTLYAGQLLNGILNYKDKKIKIAKLNTKADNIFFSYYIKSQGIQHGFLLNGEQSKVVPYFWVDKDGIEHNTKDEWIKNATYIMDDQGNKVFGIEWKKLNVKDTIVGYIKKWYELTYDIKNGIKL